MYIEELQNRIKKLEKENKRLKEVLGWDVSRLVKINSRYEKE